MTISTPLNGEQMDVRTPRRRQAVIFVMVLLTAALGLIDVGQRSAAAAVTAVKGSACGYYTNVGLFGGPQNLRGCGQTSGGTTSASPFVSLPAGGSATPITATDPDGAKATYGPAAIFAGIWPNEASTAPPSGPISVSTQGTPAGGTVTSKADIVRRDPPNALSPGGFGPGPVEGDELHSTCTATESSVTGSTTFKNAKLTTTTDAGGSPIAQEAVPDNPPVNYTRSGVITNVGDVFTVVYNEQILNSDGSLTVNAFHMYLFGPVAVGESIGGQVTCGTTPHPAATADTVFPTCGIPVVKPVGPEDPTPLVPRQELVGVFDAGGLQSITNIQVTNGTVVVGDPTSFEPYLNFVAGQTGPLPITATRIDESKPMTWSFDATDAAGNVTHCQGINPPRVSGLFPDAGSFAGGNHVVITGTGFTGATGVLFGSTAATTFKVDSDTQITATAPAGSGEVAVTVARPSGPLTTTAGNGYTYTQEPPPVTTTTTTIPGATTTTTQASGTTTTTQAGGTTSTTSAGGATVTTTGGSTTGGGTTTEAGGAVQGSALSRTGFPGERLALVSLLSLFVGALLLAVSKRRAVSARPQSFSASRRPPGGRG